MNQLLISLMALLVSYPALAQSPNPCTIDPGRCGLLVVVAYCAEPIAASFYGGVQCAILGEDAKGHIYSTECNMPQFSHVPPVLFNKFPSQLEIAKAFSKPCLDTPNCADKFKCSLARCSLRNDLCLNHQRLSYDPAPLDIDLPCLYNCL